MSKLIGLLNSPWLGVILAAVAFLFGVGDVPFTDADSFQSWLTSHFPQLGAFAGLVAAPLFFLLKSLRERVNPADLAKALSDGKIDLGDIIGVIDTTKGPQVGTYVKSALADTAIVTLRHACKHSKPLTENLSDFAKAYYTDQCEAEPLPAA